MDDSGQRRSAAHRRSSSSQGAGSGVDTTRVRSILVVKLTFAAALVAALFLTGADAYVGMILAAVFVAASVGLDYWAYATTQSAGGTRSRRHPYLGSTGARDPIGRLFERLVSDPSASENRELADLRTDLGRIGDLSNQLERLSELARELETALPFRETKIKVLRLARQLLSADVVTLVSEQGGAFALEGVDGCEAGEVNVDCCGYYARCPVRSTFRNQSFACVPDHACSMFPLTLRSQLSMPLALADDERTVALVAAAARTHAFDEVSPVLLERLAVQVHASLSQALKHDRVRREVVSDSLTGLYNRRFFEQQAQEEIERSIGEHTPLTLLMLDIDHFSLVNDGYGTRTGDRVLQSVARYLKTNVRESDICARYGGEEFALLLPDTPGTSTMHLAERLRKNLAQLMHTGLGLPDHVSITVSCGVASCPRDATDYAMLVRTAERALREAKRRGRNQVVRAKMGGPGDGDSTQAPTGRPSLTSAGRLQVVSAPEQERPHR
jgi:diguanylate cyclase (GGDEF)-like protein